MEISFEPRFLMEAVGASSKEDFKEFKAQVRSTLLANAMDEARCVVELREKLSKETGD
jgi:hypothetical protein